MSLHVNYWSSLHVCVSEKCIIKSIFNVYLFDLQVLSIPFKVIDLNWLN
jgi:hypothetical protein